jgi:hypothetical protein
MLVITDLAFTDKKCRQFYQSDGMQYAAGAENNPNHHIFRWTG